MAAETIVIIPTDELFSGEYAEEINHLPQSSSVFTLDKPDKPVIPHEVVPKHVFRSEESKLNHVRTKLAEISDSRKIPQVPYRSLTEIAPLFNEPDGFVERQRDKINALRGDGIFDAPYTDTPEAEEAQFSDFARKLSAMKASAEGYAIRETKKTYNPNTESLIKDTEDYKLRKSQALQAYIQLDALEALSPTEKELGMNNFRNWWGEPGEEYLATYKRIVNSLQDPEAVEPRIPGIIEKINTSIGNSIDSFGGKVDHVVLRNSPEPREEVPEADTNIIAILKDKEMSMRTKMQLLRYGGYSMKEVGIIAAGIGIAIPTTAAAKFVGDLGAVALGSYTQGIGTFQEISNEAKAGLAAAAYVGYHFTARKYGAASHRLLEKYGISFNITATATFIATRFRPKWYRKLSVKNSVSGVEVGSDAYLVLPSLLTQDPTFFTTVNAFGIAFTAAQIGVTEGVGFAADKISERKQKKQKINQENTGRVLPHSGILVNPKVKLT
jgi:hypothetical protein